MMRRPIRIIVPPMHTDPCTALATKEALLGRFAADFLPSALPEPVRSRLRELAQPVGAAAGESLLVDCIQGRIVHIAHGAAKLVAHASQQREQVLSFHFAGDLVLVPARAAHGYTLCALNACEGLAFAADPVFGLARSDAALGHALLTRTRRALARSREKTIALGRKTAQERVASFLVAMADRIGMPDGNSCMLDLAMTRRDIADSLGLTIETISRQMGELRDAGLLETSGRSLVHLRDMPGLAARAGHLAPAALTISSI